MLGISRPLKSICAQRTAIVAPFDGPPATGCAAPGCSEFSRAALAKN